MTTTSTSSNLPDKDQIRVHVRRDGSIERQRFNGRVWRQLCKYDGGEECQAFVAYRSLCVGHYHQTSGITVNESKRRQLIQQSAAAAASSKATTTVPSKLRYSIETPLSLGLKNWRRKTIQPNSSTNMNNQSSQIPSTIINNNNSNKRRKSDEWVLLKRCRFDSTQNIPPVQSILPNTSTTTIDESAATSDSNQACSSASSLDSHLDDYVLAPKPISITSSRLTDEQMDRLDQFLQRFNIHYSDEIDDKTTHLITDDTTIPFVCALSSKVVHALARHLTVLSIRWIDECLRCDKLLLDELALQFEIRGDLTCSTMYHGGMQRSRLITRRHSLFSKHIFMLKCSGVQNLMDNQELRTLITLCGGHTCSSLRTDQVTRWTAQGKMIVVLCEQSYVQERQEKYWKCVELGIRFCSPEFIIESIAQYQVQDYGIYEEEPQHDDD
jgi:ribosome assembly protein YihI (activator of Der GTPase)